MASLGFSDSQDSLTNSIASIKATCLSSIPASSSNKFSIGFTVNPLNQMDEYPYKWENVLMLTEHAARIASKLKDKNCIALLALRKNLGFNLAKDITI